MTTNFTPRMFSNETSIGRVGGIMRLILLAMIFVSLIATTLNGQRKKSTLSDFDSSAAAITKLDWLMIKAQIQVMKDTQPVSDVGWPAYYYNKAQNALRASAYVNKQWWAQADTETAKEELSSKGMLYCSTLFYSDPQLEPLIKNNTTGCEVHFYTWSNTAKKISLAIYLADKNELILN